MAPYSYTSLTKKPTSKVGVYREKFNIGYICGGYAISFCSHNHRHRHRHRPCLKLPSPKKYRFSELSATKLSRDHILDIFSLNKFRGMSVLCKTFSIFSRCHPKKSHFGPKCPFWGLRRSSDGPGEPDLVPTVGCPEHQNGTNFSLCQWSEKKYWFANY